MPEEAADAESRPDRLWVFAPYGVSAGSTRVRVENWLSRAGPAVAARRSYYTGAGDNRPKTLITQRSRVLEAERALRTTIAEMRSAHPACLVSREVSPVSLGRAERQVLRYARVGVYDVDDALYARTSAPATPIWLARRRRVSAAARHADVVIAGSDHLANWFERVAGDVRVIPSCVEPSAYREKTDFALHDPPIIGWMGSRTGERYLDAIAPALRHVHDRTGARLHVCGDPSQALPDAVAGFAHRVPWTIDAGHRFPSECDIGVMPLADGEWERGKCAYKLLEYGAAALPSVGSPVGANRQLLARAAAPSPADPHEWGEAILDLLWAPAEVRAEAGRRLRSVVEAEYSYDRWETSFWNAFEGR